MFKKRINIFYLNLSMYYKIEYHFSEIYFRDIYFFYIKLVYFYGLY